MGNGQQPETKKPVENKKEPNQQITKSSTSEADIKEYFKTQFPIVISPQVFDIREEIKQIRRYFHTNPELKFEEKNTASNIEAYLKELGIETKTKIATTGVVGLLKGDHDGPCIMLRADMDALPIEERKTADNEQFVSKNKGIMHACGHDAHLAILCGAAKILSSLKHLLHGSVKFVFQPGEEGGTGAQKMIDEKILIEPYVDQVYGLHVWSYDKFGTARVINGPLMAGCILFTIDVFGRGGPTAAPQDSNDVVVAMSYLTQELHTIISRDLNPTQSGVITIGRIDCGISAHTIAERAKLYGTMRWFDEHDYEIMMERIRNICMGVEHSFKVKIQYEQTTPKYPAVVNMNKECCDLVYKSINQVLPCTEMSGVVRDMDYKTMISEDFGFFLQERPGCFFLLGCGVEGDVDGQFGHHKADFKLDERCLAVGSQIFTTLVLERLVKWTD